MRYDDIVLFYFFRLGNTVAEKSKVAARRQSPCGSLSGSLAVYGSVPLSSLPGSVASPVMTPVGVRTGLV